LTVKKQTLTRAINAIRYIQHAREKSEFTVVVNIPSATLLLFKGDTVVLESKVIVGKPSNRTPTISSVITDMVLYPYWFVPASIAVKELLPAIKKNPAFLAANGFQVLNKNGQLVDPATIEWNALSATNFPYILRQSTGCDNSLGIIKLNFYNPFNVYLHDTPWKNLFTRSRRFYSHGCIRVEKATELARYLLKDNSIAVDTLEEKGCLLNKKPVTVAFQQQTPIFVLYNTAWIDSNAIVKFYPDIYRKFPSRQKR
jgi:murein L,D-transpeptidase YcbB/YkuD